MYLSYVYCSPVLSVLLFKDLFINWRGRVTDTEMKEEAENRGLLPTDSPNGHNSWRWADLKPGARRFLWVSHMDAGAQALGPYSTSFPDH